MSKKKVVAFLAFAIFLFPSFSGALETSEYYRGDIQKYPSPIPLSKVEKKDQIPIDEFAATGQQFSKSKSFGNKSAEVTLLGLKGPGSIKGQSARKGMRFIVATTKWENIHPRQRVDKKKLEGKADRTMGSGSIFFGKAGGGNGTKGFIEKDVPYKIPKWGDHVIFLADGIAYPLDSGSGALTDGADPGRGMVISRLHATKNVTFSFQVPAEAQNLAFHFFDYDNGHITIPIKGDLEKAKGPPSLKPSSHKIATVKLDADVLEIGNIPDYQGEKAPPGWQFREARLIGVSKSARGGRGDILQLNQEKELWLQDREGFLYSPLPAAGKYLRFFPEYLTLQRAIFLLPEGAVPANLIVRAGVKTFTLPVGGGTLMLPDKGKSWKDGETAEFYLVGKRVKERATILDMVVSNLVKEKGLEFSPLRQFQIKAAGKTLRPDKRHTEALAHGAKKKMVIPPGTRVRFLLVFHAAEKGSRLLYRGFKSRHELALEGIPASSMQVSSLKAPPTPRFTSKRGKRPRKARAPSESGSKKPGEGKTTEEPSEKQVLSLQIPPSIDAEGAAAEVEPNDEPAKAMSLDKEHNYMVRGILEPGDNDYFALSVDGPPGLWNVKAKGKMIQRLAYLDSSGKEGVTRRPSRRDKYSEIHNLYLLPGQHLFKIRAPPRGKRGEYLFWLEPLGAPDPLREKEINDDESRAQKVLIGHAMHGSLTNGDYDYFRFSLSILSKIRIKATPDPGGKLSMQLSGNEAASRIKGYSRKEGEVVEKAGILPSGDYLMNLHGSGAYTFLVEQLPPLFEENRLVEGQIKIETPENPITVSSFWHQAQRVSAKVRLKNNSSTRKNLTLHTWANRDGLTIRPDRDKVTLGPGAGQELLLQIRVPADIPTGNPIEAWIVAIGKSGRQSGRLVINPECGADPIKPMDAWAVPESMLGGLDQAWDSLGGNVPGAVKHDSRRALFNGLTPSDQNWHTYSKSLKKTPPEIIVTLAGDGQIPVAGIILNPMGCNSSGEIPKKFEVFLSSDGKAFSKVLTGRMTRHPVDQPFPFKRPTPARFARLRILSNQSGGKRVCLGEWKIVGKPGFSPWKGKGPNLADPGLGGHVVRSSPLFGSFNEISMLTESIERPVTRLEAGRTNEWVVGFHHNRAAMISAIQWVENPVKDLYRRLKEVQLSSSLESPLGPWKHLGLLKLEEKGQSSFTLPSPEWVRFIRISASDLEKSGRYHLPETLRVIEKKTGEDYRSILGEWGHYGNRSYLEFAKSEGEEREDGNIYSSGGTRENPLLLKTGTILSGSVEIGKDEDWYHVNVGKGKNSLTITLKGEPALKAKPTLFDSDGREIPLIEYSTSGRKSLFTAGVGPGTYRLKVYEPPRNIALVWDQSGSVTSFVPNLYRTLALFSEGITPKREFANFLPFQDKNPRFILEGWNDQPLILLQALNDYDRKASSSNAELNLLKAVRELGKQEGNRAVVLLTDADSGGYGKSEELWMAMANVRPRIFTVELHRGQDQSSRHQDLMQDWAMANRGHYSFFRSQSDLDVALDRAVCYLRRPATYSVKAETNFVKPPQPGSIEVKGGSLPGNAIELILDASGSMYKKLKDGSTRISVAKSVMTRLVKEVIPKGTPVALRVYGHREAKSCRTDLEVPLKPLDPKQMSSKIAKIDPKNRSKTPLAASIEKVAQDLRGVKGEKVVILVTDGEESCDGDPLEAIQALKETGIEIALNIVGFAIEDKVLMDTFASWAGIGGGTYFQAADEKELSTAMDHAMRPKFQVFNEEGGVVAKGIAGGKAVPVPAGKYRIRIFTSPVKTVEGVLVEPGKRVTID